MRNSLKITPKRGEIWFLELDPARGAEMKKTRPVVIISGDSLGVLPLKLVVPLTGWNPRYDNKIWLVHVATSTKNGLIKTSVADVLQTRSVTLERFVQKLGVLESATLERIAKVLTVLVEAK